ncbi:MAG: ATP-binding cassette domain-containing protein [Actinobacteria bacterium]|nr:ATP-binding cassette domain-containing protein [Actinomycetota bacterium]
MGEFAIEMRRVVKRFGATVALDGLSLQVASRSIVGLLGPNGAGKTTTIDVLATLVRPDEGTACVVGCDVLSAPAAVRSLIGMTGQFAALDENLTARENLVLFGRLLKLGKSGARARADELLVRFDLADSADRLVRTFSGGMRRRLDLAVSLLAEPAVLFLDEPTTGLDPRSRTALWEMVRELRDQGMTILLTTQQLDEADALADRIVVIDHGQVIAEGTAAELKERVGGAVCHVIVGDESRDRAVAALTPMGNVSCDGTRLLVPATAPSAVVDVVRQLDAAGIPVNDLEVRHTTLDDVFFAVTGHAAGAGPLDQPDPDMPAATVARTDDEGERLHGVSS